MNRRVKSFRFECSRCGVCCQWGGWVCLLPDDLHRLAGHLGLSLSQTIRRYTRHIAVEFTSEEGTEIVPYLALLPGDGPCIFLKDALCQVHDAKPIHCRESPLLAEFLIEPEGMERFATLCPGFGRGPSIPTRAIREALARQMTRDLAYDAWLESHGGSLSRALGVRLPKPTPITGLGVELDYGVDTPVNPAPEKPPTPKRKKERARCNFPFIVRIGRVILLGDLRA